MHQSMVLIVGIMIGGIVAICISSLVGYARNRGTYRADAHRDRIMSEVEKKWTEIDALISSYRNGRVDEFSFRATMGELIERIKKLYTPALHLLNIFFVKYTEKLLEEYGRILDSQGEVQPRDTRVSAPAPIHRTTESAIPQSFTFQQQQPSVQAPEEETGVSDGEGESVSLAAAFQPETPAYQPPEAPVFQQPDTSAYQPPEAPVYERLEQEPVAEQPIDEAARETFQMSSLQIEEPAAEEMALARKNDDELPIETFLEMEPGTGSADKGVELKIEIPAQESVFEQRTAEARVSPEEQLFEEMAPVEMAPVPEPSAEEIRSAIPHTESEEVGDSTVRYDFVPPALIPLPSQEKTPAQPATTHSAEEITHPATIFDVEAETIIADRTTIVGRQPASAEPEEDKKTLGITGEDVINTFDRMFGIKR